MEDFLLALGKILPWLVMLFGIYLFIIIIAYFIGIMKAKKKDKTIKLIMNGLGKAFFIVAIPMLFVSMGFSIYNFVTSSWNANAFNATTIVNLLFVYAFQDVFFAGRSVLLIGNKRYEIKRIKSVRYPGKRKVVFIYGNKEYKISLRYTPQSELKAYIR